MIERANPVLNGLHQFKTQQFAQEPSVQRQEISAENQLQESEDPQKEPIQAKQFTSSPPEDPPQDKNTSSASKGTLSNLQAKGNKEQLKIQSQVESDGTIQPKCSGCEQKKEDNKSQFIQTKLTLGEPGYQYEQEADHMAAKVIAMPDSAIQQSIQRQTEKEQLPLAKSITPLVQRSASGTTQASPNIENRLTNSKGGGSPLPTHVRSFMEPRFGTDFSAVRVHTDSTAVQMNKELGAQAFTHGSDIYYGGGKAPSIDELTAHELTHTIQQGAVSISNKDVQLKVKEEEEPESLQAKDILNHPSDLTLNKEQSLQLKEDELEATKENYIQAKQFTSLSSNEPQNLIQRQPLVISSVSPRIQGGFLGIPTSIEEARQKILSPVARLASSIPGYPLLTVIIGKDPISEAPVERNATNLIRGVLSLIPKGQEFFNNLQQSGAIDKAFNWFNEQIAKLNLTWETIKGLFKRVWDSLSITDLVSPSSAFEKIKNVFGEPIGRIKDFAINAGTKVMEFVFEGVMGAGGTRVMEIIRRAGGVFNTIISDPVKFIGHLVGAVRGGFQQFSTNILTHLKTGLVGWLFGALAGAGLTLPAQFDLKGVVSLALQVLGLTYQRLRGMLVKAIGEQKVAKLEKAFDFLMMIVTQGLGAAWQKITEFVGNIQETVMGGIREWVQNSIITAAITKLLSMFNPAGAIIQAVTAIYNTVMFFIERADQIAALGEAVFSSIGSIAAGNIGAAANYVEQTMGRTLPVVISFLARLIGLGGISEQIKNVIKKIQAPIDTAIGKVADFIVQKGKSLLGKGVGNNAADADPEKAQKVRQGLTALETEERKYVDENDAITKESAEQAAANTKRQHPIFQSITVISKDDRWDYNYVVQKTEEQGKKKRRTAEEDLQLAKNYFGNRRFKAQELVSFLKSTRLSERTIDNRIRQWKDDSVLFTYESTNKDPNKDFSFDRNSIQAGVRPVRSSNRSTYGYSNPDNTSTEGLKIIRKSLIIELDPTSPTGYKYNYAPGKENNLNYLQTEARFKCQRTPKILKWGEFHMGHHPEGASEHWNRIGHTQTKQDNNKWNKDDNNYWGVEDAATSQATGGGTDRYLIPGPPDHPDSHPMWWDPNHPDYAG